MDDPEIHNQLIDALYSPDIDQALFHQQLIQPILCIHQLLRKMFLLLLLRLLHQFQQLEDQDKISLLHSVPIVLYQHLEVLDDRYLHVSVFGLDQLEVDREQLFLRDDVHQEHLGNSLCEDLYGVASDLLAFAVGEADELGDEQVPDGDYLPSVRLDDLLHLPNPEGLVLQPQPIIRVL